MSQQHPVNDIVATRAKRWIIKTQAGLDEKQQADFEQWLDQHPDHRREFERLTKLWQELDMIAGDFVSGDYLQNEADTAPLHGRRKRYWWSAATAACLLLVFGLAFKQPDSSSVVVAQSSSYYSSHKGELQSVELADGSTMQLGPASIAQVRFNQHQRSVELVAGEAFFDVAKDPQRPFVVSTSLGDARAVGTAFNVHLYGRQLEVTVHEGIVDVSTIKQAEAARLVVGQRAKIGSAGIKTYDGVDLANSAAWRRGALVFSELPLYQVVADLNRYSQVPIVIADDRLLDIQVSGIFNGHDIE